ncbi:uncharacterized protein ynbb [Phtheirospermum japonicum]|uniref:Uncharacterized protein ynbb n=1 Tax=Phtheirospermum japonicum TaxID=374723 RepID=A0A830D3L3_9LAMI|nr:uncharacterized protein ynbb [Phtheirospermum japonicum]
MFLVLSSTTSAYPTPAFTLPCAAAVVSPGAKVFMRSKFRVSAVSLCLEEQIFVPEVEKAVDSLYSEFRAVDNLVARNSARVLKAFQNARVGTHHFSGSTGYGHDEAGGREALDQAFAEIFGAESAIVRAQFFSGTHAITCALFAFLRPGDEHVRLIIFQLLAVAGAPYDTLEEVIGIRDSDNIGSLRDFGIDYREVPLAEDGGLDWDALRIALKPQTKCALIQRSCGYSWRRSLSVDEIGRAIKIIKLQNPNCLVMVDNCYGEFTERIEPPMVGADLIAGSFIKNPGGTIAPCGGYVAGSKKWVAAAAARLSAPGLGRGYKVQPGRRFPRHDVVQAVQLGSRERLLAFCEAVQRSSPVSSFTKPIAGATPGYASEVIFADGTFIDGSTSELSCDGPLREPFAVYCQWPAMNYTMLSADHVKLYFRLFVGSDGQRYVHRETTMDRGQFTLMGSTVCVMLCLHFSIQLVSQHNLSWKKPKEQKAIIIIVLMAPLYAISSYVDRLCWDTNCIEKCRQSMTHTVDPIRPHTVRLDHKNLKLLKNWTWQFVVIRPVCSVLMIACQLLDIYPSWLSWTFTIILNVSVSLALYSLVIFYHVFAKELAPHKPLAKFLCVKGIVFFCFWQGIVLDMLVAIGLIKSNHFWLDVEHLEEALQNVLVIVEMVFFSLFMQYAYSAEPYRTGSLVSEKTDKKKE